MSKQYNSTLFLVLLLGALSGFGPLVVDLYLPSLPQMVDFFATTPSMAQVTLTTAMIGLGLGQLLIGPISDKFGRKKPLIISLLIYLTSTILIIFASTMETLITLRGLQGLSAAGCVVISRAVATDLYHGAELRHFFSLLMVVNGIAPILSPVLGSILLSFTDWRGLFVFLAIVGVVLFVFSTKLHESLTVEKRFTGSFISTFMILFKVIQNRVFLQFCLLQACLLSGMFAYISASSFIFQQHYGLSPFAYGLCFALNGSGIVIGSRCASLLENRTALNIGVFGFVAMAAYIACVLLGNASVWLVEAGFFALLLCLGFVLPISSALAMNAERQSAGSASAFLGFLSFFFGGIVSPLVGMGNMLFTTALCICISALLGLMVYLSVRPRMTS